MGGELTAESEPGQGSAFRFEIPFGVADAGRSSRRARALLPASARVLVADDNATNREILRAYLRGRVAVCELATDAREAREMLAMAASSGRPYDVAVLDADLAGIDAAIAPRAWSR